MRSKTVRSKTLGAFVALAIAVSGCGSSADDESGSTAETTSTTADTAASPPEPEVPEFALAQDVPYFDDAPGLSTPVLDVYAPAEDGLWPIVVTFHPDAAVHTKASTTGLARSIAEQGAVVINPTYGGPGTDVGRSAELFRTNVDQSTCSVWFAIENAAEFGGDVSDIRLVGFSGGANMAAAVAMYPSDDDSRCSSPATDFTVSEVVAFEGDFVLGAGWDDVVRDDPTFYEDMTVWSHIEGYTGGPIRVLVDSETTIAITGVEEFLDLRHPDGPVREAWEALGVIGEDRATLVQANTMFHDLLLEAGKETSLTTIEASNHSLSEAAQDAIIDLLFGDTGS